MSRIVSDKTRYLNGEKEISNSGECSKIQTPLWNLIGGFLT